MKKQFLRLCLAALALMLLLASCAKAPVLESKDGVYVNEKTGVSYLLAPENYEAVAIDKDKTIARFPNKKMDDTLFYAIPGMPSQAYLSNDFYELYYAADLKLPTLAEMAPHSALICKTAVISYSLVEIDEAELIDALIALYAGQGVDEDLLITEAGVPEQYTLKFQSKDYPSFYYTLNYRRYDKEVTVYDLITDAENFEVKYPGVQVTTEEYKGETYAVYHLGTEILFDRTTGTCYPMGDMLKTYWEYLSSTGAETDTAAAN